MLAQDNGQVSSCDEVLEHGNPQYRHNDPLSLIKI